MKGLIYYLCGIILLISLISVLSSGAVVAQSIDNTTMLSGDQQFSEEPNADKNATYLIELEQFQSSQTERAQNSVGGLKSHAQDSQVGTTKKIESVKNTKILSKLWLSNTIVVDTSPNQLKKLRSIPEVVSIRKNGKISLPDPVKNPSNNRTNTEKITSQSEDRYTYGLDQINAPKTYEKFENKGDGIRVAVIDTGVDPNHPDIDIKSRNFAEFDVYGSEIADPTIRDTGVHGTHTSGTVIGGDAGGKQIGVAPDATLMHAVGLPGGSGTTAQIIASMEWAIENNADIISMSLGGNIDPNFINALRNAEKAGVVVVAASGNSGSGETGSPGADRSSFSVGATNQEQKVAQFSGGKNIFIPNVYPNTSRLPDDYPTRYVVPDFTAPGAEISSANPEDRGGGYRELDGTSMATPHVAGAIAVGLSNSNDNSISPDEVYNILASTANKPDNITKEQDIRYGFGVIDTYNFTRNIVNDDTKTISGTVTNNISGKPIAGATISINNTGEQVETNKDGSYELPTLAEGNTTINLNTYPNKKNRTINLTGNDKFNQNFSVDANEVAALVGWNQGGFSIPNYPRPVNESFYPDVYVTGYGSNVEKNKTIKYHVDNEILAEKKIRLSDGETKRVKIDTYPGVELNKTHIPTVEYKISSNNDAVTRRGIVYSPLNGDGSQDNPHQITNAPQLYAIANPPDYGEPDILHYRLENNIDMGGKDWIEPILTSSGSALDGDGHSIQNMTLDTPRTTPGGLIRNLNGNSSINNVHVENATVVGGGQTGGLVGIVWYNATIKQSTFNGSVRATHKTGGLAASNWGTIENSSTNATVYTQDRVRAPFSGRIAGGLVGSNSNGGKIKRSYASGDVRAERSTAGGLVGVNQNGPDQKQSKIINSYAQGTVTTGTDGGGLVGSNTDSLVDRTYAVGNVSTTNPDGEAGGLIGYTSNGSVNQSYWNTQSTTQTNSEGGTALTTAEMTKSADKNMNGFSFGTIWEAHPNTYPTLITATNGSKNTNNDDRNSHPNAKLEYTPTIPTLAENVTFNASGSVDPDGTISNYDWDFDDDGTVDASGETVTHSFDSAGEYTVTLTVTDDDGATNTTIKTITVSRPANTDSGFNITSVNITDTTTPGETVDLQVTVQNNLQQEAARTLTFELGDARTTAELTLAAGESDQVVAALPASSKAGSDGYNISTATDSVTGTITVEDAPKSDSVELRNVTIDPQTVATDGSTHNLSFTVENLSPDGNPDEFTITMPDTVDVESVDIVESGNLSPDNPTAENPITFSVNSTQTTQAKMEVELTLSPSTD